MKKCKISFSITFNPDILNNRFKVFIDKLMEISGYYSIISRKDNNDLWDEYITEDNKFYVVISEFTDEEITMLADKQYNIEILKNESEEYHE